MLFVLIAVLGAFFSSAGVVLQAQDASKKPLHLTLKISLLYELVKHPAWVLGVFFSLLASAAQIAALTHLPVAFVEPTIAGGIIFVPFLEFFFNGFPIKINAVLITVIVALGICALTLILPQSDLHIPGNVLFYLLIASTAIVALLSVLVRQNKLSDHAKGAGLAITAGVCFATTALLAKFIAVGNFASTAFWIATSAMVLFALFGFLAQTSALQRISATEDTPIVLVFAALLPVIGAHYIFHEPWGHPILTLAIIMIVIGCSAKLASGKDLIRMPARPQ